MTDSCNLTQQPGVTPQASLGTPPEGHIKADMTLALTHRVRAKARSTETQSYFLCSGPWRAAFLYRPSRIY